MPRLALPRTLLFLPSLLLAAACHDAPPIDPGGGEERGPATITTYADGVIAGELEVYVHDDAGELRAGYRSGPDGRVTVSVADDWSVTVLDDVEGFRHADTLIGVQRGDDLALGQRAPMRADGSGTLAIGQLAPLPGAAGFKVSLCGPVLTTTPVSDPSAATMVTYDPHHTDGDGGALLIAEAEVDGERRFALLDAPDVATVPQPVQFGAWQPLATAAATVIAPAAALDVEVRLRSLHGCTIGGGGGTGPEIEVDRYPGLPVTLASASAWYRRDDRQTSRTSRRFAIEDDALPALFDLSAPPPRIDDVAVSVYGSGTVLSWSRSDAPGGDGLVIVLGPAADLQWTITAPDGDDSLILPRLPDLPATAPAWVNVNLVDLDDAADFSDLAAMAGLPLWDQPGWTTTGTWQL